MAPLRHLSSRILCLIFSESSNIFGFIIFIVDIVKKVAKILNSEQKLRKYI